MKSGSKKYIITTLLNAFIVFIIGVETGNAIVCNSILNRFYLGLQSNRQKVRNLFPKEYWPVLDQHSHLEYVIESKYSKTGVKELMKNYWRTKEDFAQYISMYCHYCRRKTEGKYTRYYPVSNLFDTLGNRKYILKNLRPFIKDEEIIIVVFSPDQYLKSSNDINPFGVKDGYHVYKQRGNRACTSAVSAMLILDRGKKVNWDEIAETNLGTEDSMRREIEAAGLIPITTVLTDSTLLKKEGGQKLFESMEKLIKDNGSIITFVGGEIGNHVIIVDAVSWKNRAAKIRDPYHGWQIIIKMSALLERLFGELFGETVEFIQIKREEGRK